MRRYGTRPQLLAIGLAILAGFVDALGFLNLRGMFVSFMSGNSTRLAVGAETPAHGSLFAGTLIAVFVAGVMAGTAVGTAAGRWRKQAVLMLVLLVLTVACFAASLGEESVVPVLLMAAAMGAANAVFQREGEVSIGVTYMTGTLVKLGQHLTFALSGGPRFSWVSYLLLWLGLTLGAVAGAMMFRIFALQALWIAVVLAASLLVWAIALGPLPEKT